MKKLLLPIIALWIAGCTPDKQPDSFIPAWAKDVVWYQIFVERFNNGDPGNDPSPATISTPSASIAVPADWKLTPWSWNWHQQEPWAAATGRDLRQTLQHRRYGGDLQGVIDKLDYLQQLGITALYFNPLNDAPSLHKYDARNYHHIDVNFGPDPQGDMAVIAGENPNDPSTWQWTSADLLFLKLVEECHRRHIRVIMDYSWNHTGVLFWAWQDILKNQEQSPYKDWYEVLKFDDPKTPGNEFDYKGWLNIKSLPEFKKVHLKGAREHGKPFEGNLPEAVKEHVFAVSRRWLAPNGDVSRGIDGFRLDVADQVPMGFWRDYRRFVKSVNPDALLVGEVWWAHWPDTFMDPAPYVNERVFDAIMYYHAYRPARGFFAGVDPVYQASDLAKDLETEWCKLPKGSAYAMMNVNATHDSPRLLSCFENKGKYKYRANPYEDENYLTGKPDEETYTRVRLYLVHQFTSIGSPHIWNGDEMGMWGGDDPDCRKPLWWKEQHIDPEISPGPDSQLPKISQPEFNENHFRLYQTLIRIRNENPALKEGNLRFIVADKHRLMYQRSGEKGSLVIAFNLGSCQAGFDLTDPPDHFVDLLTGDTIKSKPLILAPMQAVILKPL